MTGTVHWRSLRGVRYCERRGNLSFSNSLTICDCRSVISCKVQRQRFDHDDTTNSTGGGETEGELGTFTYFPHSLVACGATWGCLPSSLLHASYIEVILLGECYNPLFVGESLAKIDSPCHEPYNEPVPPREIYRAVIRGCPAIPTFANSCV